MYVLVTYDCREERVRRKVRSLLRKYSFSMLAYSVYVGRGNRGIAERIASALSRILGENDRASVILLQDFQYEVLLDITKGSVSARGEEARVIVFFGRAGARGNETARGHPNM